MLLLTPLGRREEALQGVHDRPVEPDGAEPFGQPLLLQEGLQQGAALGPARLPQHRERVHARRELLPVGQGIPRAGGLRTSIPVLLSGMLWSRPLLE